MICKYCGGVFRKEDYQFCPYCDMEIPAEENAVKDSPAPKKSKTQKWNLDKLSEVRIFADLDPHEPHGTVKVTVKGNPGLTSPATGANYVMLFDAGAYQVRLSKGDQDISEFIELPTGRHEGILKYYSWRDTSLSQPETTRNDMITINVNEHYTTEILIKTGTILLPRKIEVKYTTAPSRR